MDMNDGIVLMYYGIGHGYMVSRIKNTWVYDSIPMEGPLYTGTGGGNVYLVPCIHHYTTVGRSTGIYS